MRVGLLIARVFGPSGVRKGKVLLKQPKRGRLCPLFPEHVWRYDFKEDRIHNEVKFRILNEIDKYTFKCLAIKVIDGSIHMMSLRCSPSCLSNAAVLSIFLLVSVLNLSPSGSGMGIQVSDSSFVH